MTAIYKCECVRVVGVSGVGEGDIVSYKLTQKHVSRYQMVSVYAHVFATKECKLMEGSYHKQYEACNVAMFGWGVKAVSAPAGL